MRTSSATSGHSTARPAAGAAGSACTRFQKSSLSKFVPSASPSTALLTAAQFAPYRVERIGALDRVRVTCDAAQQLPVATDPDYQYEPKPPSEVPPVAARLLMEYFDDPTCAGTSTAILEAFPVRTAGAMTRAEKHGWGLHAQEHLGFWRIVCLTAGLLVGPCAFFVYWLVVYPGDLQNASVPLALAFGFIGTFAVLFDRGK